MAVSEDVAKQKEISEKLQRTYKLEKWKDLLFELFPNAQFYSPADIVDLEREDQQRMASSIKKIGHVELKKSEVSLQNTGYGDDIITFIEVELKDDQVNLTKNRVGLRNLVSNEVVPGLTDAALIAYYQPQEKEWRITFYSEKFDWDSEGKMVVKSNHRKRYTYVVGPTETCKTAGEQFVKIIKAGEQKTLETVIKAFSVQKVSDEFFDEYKYQYDKFVGYITGTVYTKDGEQEYPFENIGKSFSSFFKINSEDPKKTARNFVKKLLGRIVFLYFVQKKGWLGNDYKFIQTLFKKAKEEGHADLFYQTWLRKLFFEGLNTDFSNSFELPDSQIVEIPFLNGGLFEMDEVDKKLENFTLPAWLFHNPAKSEEPENKYTHGVKRGFLDFLNAFNFTVHEDSPGDHTIAVDPEMLGHIFENLLEDNKEKGAYYTPKPVVHFMCQESIIEYLLTSLTDDDTSEETHEHLRNKLEDLVKNHNVGRLSGKTREILQALQSVKVCDPAIGSGAFPMGILQEIFQVVDTFHFYESDEFYEGWQLEDGNWNPAEVKKQIIQNSIYGVDIEKGAVDIARLRFWLSLIVDEVEPTPLPNLDYKIIVGNSLVSHLKIDGEEHIININWEMEGEVESTKNLLKNLEDVLLKIVENQKEYFDADRNRKDALKQKIEQLKIEAIIHQLHYDRNDYVSKNKDEGSFFEENTERKLKLISFNKLIQKLESRKKDPKSIDYFEWKFDFPEILNDKLNNKTGFDIVIANPPYIGEKGNSEVFEELKKVPKWNEFYRRRSNTYYFFIKKGVELLKKDGIQCLITPREFTNADWSNKVRKVMTDETRILKLVDFRGIQVFDDVGTSSFITLHKRSDNKESYKFKFKLVENDISQLSSKRNYEVKESIILGDDGRKLWHFDQVELKKSQHIVKLDKLYETSQGIITGADKVTANHINKGYIDESYYKRGIYKLKPETDYRIVDDKYELKIRDSWRELSEEDLKFIKPFIKTENLKKWQPTESNIKLLYVGSNSLTKNIEDYLKQFDKVLLNRSTTVAEGRVISLEEFKSFNKKDIKNNYSSAGAVQRIMRSKNWFLPFYEREKIPFESVKIIFNTKTMNPFCFSERAAYSTGGGGGGQTFVFPNRSNYWEIVKENSSIKEYVLFTNAVLNSNLITSFILSSNYNQLSTKKIGEILIPKISFSDDGNFKLYKSIIDEVYKVIDGSGDEQMIDLCIYKLYNLTWEEVQLVDSKFKMSKTAYEEFKV